MTRDRLGRPTTDPTAAFPEVPERLDLTAEDAWREAMTYLADGLPFHAHEVFEQRWRCCPSDERRLWQALAQWAAALTHRARGNDVGARSIAATVRSSLAAVEVVPPVDRTIVEDSLDELDRLA